MGSILFFAFCLLFCFVCVSKNVESIELKSESIFFGNGDSINDVNLEIIESSKKFKESLKSILRKEKKNGKEDINASTNTSTSTSTSASTSSDSILRDNEKVSENVNESAKETKENVEENKESITDTFMEEKFNDSIDAETFLKENEKLINKQILNDLNEKFLIEIANSSTLSFLQGLHSGENGKEEVEYQIQLEESCSPFFCEKILKAKEVEPTKKLEKTSNEAKNIDALYNELELMASDKEKGIKPHDFDDTYQNSNESTDDINVSVDSYNKDIFNNDEMLQNKETEKDERNINTSENVKADNNNNNNEKKIETVFEELFDDNGNVLAQKEKIVLTDGDNVYVLEEIVDGEGNSVKNTMDDLMDIEERNLNNGSTEKEVNMHTPTESNDYSKNTFLDSIEFLNSLKNAYNDEDNLAQTYSEKEAKEHNTTSANDENRNVNDTDAIMEADADINELKQQELEEKLINEEGKNTEDDNVEETLFNIKEEDLSKKIFEELKLNNEDKVECYNFSNDADKCSSFKKCTYVNVDNKDICFLDYNFMLFLKNNNCALQSKSSLLSISKDLLKNEIIDRQLFQLLRNSNNINFICDSITYSYLTNVVDNTNYDEVFAEE